MNEAKLKIEQWFDKGPDMATTQFIKDFNELLALLPVNSEHKDMFKAITLPLVRNVLLDHGAEL